MSANQPLHLSDLLDRIREYDLAQRAEFAWSVEKRAAELAEGSSEVKGRRKRLIEAVRRGEKRLNQLIRRYGRPSKTATFIRSFQDPAQEELREEEFQRDGPAALRAPIWEAVRTFVYIRCASVIDFVGGPELLDEWVDAVHRHESPTYPALTRAIDDLDRAGITTQLLQLISNDYPLAARHLGLPDPMRRAELRIEWEQFKAYWADKPLEINQHAEFKILAGLYDHFGNIVPYGNLSRLLKPDALAETVTVQSLDEAPEVKEAVKGIRAAFRKAGCPFQIRSVRNTGYQLTAPE